MGNNINPEYLIERKNHKLQIRNWKIISICLIFVILLLNLRFFNNITQMQGIPSADYIGSVLIDGIIYEDPKRDARLEKLVDDDSVKALIVNVNSPGGTIVGAEKIYNILRKISQKKPVSIVMGSLAASGGYLISIAGDYIVSHNGTITGSIGVIFQSAEVTELANKLGIKFDSFKSSPLKAVPNPTEKVTQEVYEVTMQSVKDSYEFFVELVSERRNIPIEQVQQIADGRVYTGRQALKLHLIDAIGNEDTALQWLKEVKKISNDLKVQEIKLKPEPKFIDVFFENLDNLVPNLMQKMYGLKAIW